MLIEVLRIVDIPADYEVHYGHSEITLHAGFEFLAYNIYTCTVDKAKNGYAPSMITDLPALQNKPNDPSTSICSMNSSESPSQLARFYESSNTLFVLSTALASSTVATSWIAVCIALSLRFCSMRTSTMSLGIPLKIKELLQAQQSKSDHLKTINISLTSIASVNDKERIKGSSLFQYYNYAIPGRMPTTSVVIVSPSSAVQSLSDSIQPNKSISGTSVAISRANPSTNQVKVHSSLSLIPMTNVTTYQDCFETYFDILATMSPQCLLNCVSLYPAFEVGVTTPDLVTRISVIVVEQLNFEDLQLLSLCSRTSSTQLQISAVSNLGMPKLHQKHLRGEVINGNPPHHLCRKSPPSRSNSKRSIHKRIVNKIRKRAPPPKRYLHRSDHHYSYGKLLWSQLRGKKMNSISLRKGLMFYASNVHSSLKYQRTERRSCCTTDSQCSLRPKQASVIPRAIEESQAFDRGVALFRGGKPSAQKSDPSASSGDDSDSDSSDTEADTSLQNPTSSHEASHSNGAMNLRPSSEAPPPLKMNSHVSQLGGEIDRNVQSSQSPAALITKSSERLLHSQGASNNYSEPLQNKQVSCISPPGNDGCQDSCIQPKLEVCMH